MALLICITLSIFFTAELTNACTVIEASSQERKPCQFPFTIAGRTFKKCTREFDPDGKLWCSTKVVNGDHVSGGEQYH